MRPDERETAYDGSLLPSSSSAGATTARDRRASGLGRDRGRSTPTTGSLLVRQLREAARAAAARAARRDAGGEGEEPLATRAAGAARGDGLHRRDVAAPRRRLDVARLLPRAHAPLPRRGRGAGERQPDADEELELVARPCAEDVGGAAASSRTRRRSRASCWPRRPGPSGVWFRRHADRRREGDQAGRVPRRADAGRRARARPPRPRGRRRDRRRPRERVPGRDVHGGRRADRGGRRGLGARRAPAEGEGADRCPSTRGCARGSCSSPTSTSPPTSR